MSMDATLVGQIMTPRTDVIGIDVTSTYAETRELVLRSAHSRIPVFEETLDHPLGVLYAKDLLSVDDPANFFLHKLMRPIPFVPETKDLASLLKEFQSGRVHIAIVLDEYGGTAGLVTIEDILEELVGEIADEHDEPVRPSILRVDDHSAEVDARVRVEELNEALELALPEDESYDTIAGFVFSRLGKIPAVGESVTSDGVRISVLAATDRSLVRLRIQKLEPTPAEEAP
jgi:putative hemolysin